MSDISNSFPLVRLQFRRAKALCNRNIPVGQNDEKTKSSAQVATSVGQHGVRQKSCGLKPGESRPFKITARFASGEREFLVRQAETSCLTVSEYIRASSLGPGYAAAIDPMRRQLLQDALRELNRQGNNLNQIAKHLNAGVVSPQEGDSLLALLSRTLMSAQRAVRQAASEGKTY